MASRSPARPVPKPVPPAATTSAFQTAAGRPVILGAGALLSPGRALEGRGTGRDTREIHFDPTLEPEQTPNANELNPNIDILVKPGS